MKSIESLFVDAFKVAAVNGYDHIVVAVDLHDTIIDSSAFNDIISNNASIKDAVCESIGDDQILALQKMSLRKDIKLILFSGTKVETLSKIAAILYTEYGITMDVVGDFDSFKPTVENQSFKIKPYYSVLLDDKSGFNIDVDWASVISAVETHDILRT
jgi:hypothetical protein